ncbi:biopolymer transporter ExbD [Ectothiorhodospiraceae bacterium WFHF3C12]|nr:biopolymer transporter ExbD [Ectothiorhodospiraceae bacterium WFHF3C12]
MNLSPRRREEPEINLTPLIDIVFLMLIFFMVSTTFLRQAELQVALPEASEEPAEAATQPLELTINKQGKVFLDGRPLVNNQTETIRRALVKARDERGELPLIIRADAGAEHQRVVSALDAAGQAGINRVSIATVPGD